MRPGLRDKDSTESSPLESSRADDVRLDTLDGEGGAKSPNAGHRRCSSSPKPARKDPVTAAPAIHKA
ncbi:hypothetical protein CCHR01_19545 [Colletotrichum chrysophilum]|uniref:Uncharacterized protein n=1 Tax=Colletotrichum chrysophilum TaxID=1836956 RepID=A0AAD8ZY36_9PEZI|nr:hypothetical protein CCHR01_19545 [Colletotrichum chrysophilum]